ncbi:hypothetical protein PYCCODRAFT_1378837 [Trametes coccinea BRFM310]|uniref:Uncharacterized protein n=1 Tax=Trametes coccinea (strain BRFM310) TaxID=1353009 RepID=A0A1Y2I642_TRAC3|nr:hypothetical protein PYCCODRAFT_1378837 [Trametes coccinea BRFM310]
MQRERAVAQAHTAAAATAHGQHSLTLKHKGVIPESVRSLVRDLIALGVKVSQVKSTITTIAEAAGMVVEGTISDRSVARAMGEGYLAAMMQIVEEVEGADSITLSSDGTGIKNIQHEAHHLELIKAAEHQRRTLGVTTAPNHTSETQLEGWVSLTSSFYNIYNASPRGRESPADQRTFATKITGMLTDHAEDQKKLVRLIQGWKTTCDRELRGEKERARMPVAELLLIVAEETTAAIEREGGTVAWDQLSAEDLERRNTEIARAVILRVGEDAYEELPGDERDLADLFIHAGCCMHKELNTVKGGYAKLERFWKDSGLDGPVLLMNRDNDSAARIGGDAGRNATENSRGGAIKLTDLAGALFRHKNDKKGQQNMFRYYFEDAIGELFTFPDTSNTRFGSNGDAASVLLTYLPLMCDFLEQVRDRKISGKWNHLEQNVYKGLQDPATLTELCVLSLYSQAISHPYMREVRGPDHPNHLSLGPLHERVQQHIAQLIADPDLLLGADTSISSGTLDGNPWDSPEVFNAIHRLIPTLPHVRGAFVTFLEGALATWERFASEFAPGGAIAQLTEVQRDRIFMAATNDANEGLLGACRVDLRQTSNISMAQWNGRKMYAMNDTKTYLAGLDAATLKFLRQQWREYNGSGREKTRRLSLAKAAAEAATQRREKKAKAAQKKRQRQQELRDLEPILDLAELTSEKLLMETIRQQISWHREWVDTGPRAQKSIPPASKISRKDDMLAALRDAVQRYNTTPQAQDHAETAMRTFDKALSCHGVDGEVEDEEDNDSGDDA